MPRVFVSPGVAKNYALDFSSPLRHVVTELDHGPRTFEQLLEHFQQGAESDLHRVKLHEHLETDAEANRFLIEQALAALGRQLHVENNSYSLAVPTAQVKFNGRRVHVYPPDPHARFHDPFSPLSGQFAENIRVPGRDSLEELRESMRAFGWLPELPAIRDERGVVIVGHRRLTVANELGLEPRFLTVDFGDGDAADARRFRLAMASNLGSKELTPQDRKRLAEYLYGERDWTMARIAEALNISIGTVSSDLADFSTPEQSATNRRTRTGRPRNADTPNARAREEMALQIIEGGASIDAVVTRFNVSERTAYEYVERARARRVATLTLTPVVEANNHEPSISTVRIVRVEEVPQPPVETVRVRVEEAPPREPEVVTLRIEQVCTRCCPIHCPS